MKMRAIMALAGVAISLVLQVGCVGRGPSVISSNDLKVVATTDAGVELSKRKAAGKSSWAIVCNGTCAGAPALAFFERSEAADDSVAVETLYGVEFIVERKAMDLVDKWGTIVVRCVHPGSRDLVAEFSKKAPSQ